MSRDMADEKYSKSIDLYFESNFKNPVQGKRNFTVDL